MPGSPAARVTDPIDHSSSFAGLVIGAVAGVALGAALAVGAVAATVVTGGAAALLIGGAIAAGGAGGALGGAYIGEVIPKPGTGNLITGSDCVVIGNLLASRAGDHAADCKGVVFAHGTPLVAQGSSTVLIHNKPVARKGDKLVCGATIASGCASVLIGGSTTTVVPMDGEVPAWLRTTLVVVGIAGAVVATGGAALAFGLGAAIGGAVGGLVGGSLLGSAGGAIGRSIGGAFGNAELGARIGKVAGETVGAIGGAIAGARIGIARPPATADAPSSPAPSAKAPAAAEPTPAPTVPTRVRQIVARYGNNWDPRRSVWRTIYGLEHQSGCMCSAAMRATPAPPRPPTSPALKRAMATRWKHSQVDGSAPVAPAGPQKGAAVKGDVDALAATGAPGQAPTGLAGTRPAPVDALGKTPPAMPAAPAGANPGPAGAPAGQGARQPGGVNALDPTPAALPARGPSGPVDALGKTPAAIPAA